MTITMADSENRATACPPSPSPNLRHHHQQQLFKDVSNFKTPKHNQSSRTFQSKTAGIATPQFFTASKQTPSFSLSSAKQRRPSTTAMRRLKAFELEQSQSCRKEQMKKERSTKSLAKSFTAWLNFLFENPSSCGCDQAELISECKVSRGEGEARRKAVGKGKRENVVGVGRERRSVGVNGGWRLPKRMREGEREEEEVVVNQGDFSRSKKFVYLRNSLKEVCSLDDLVERLRGHLSLDCCKEVLDVMTQVSKNIDEGRLKMRAHCPIVTDVGMREKAVKVLMCYNPVWLQTGLHVILGGESLLPNEESSSEQDTAFLKMVIEKQLFSHAGLARAYAYNKLVDGLYRPGYFETLGNVILKRFLLLVLILDRGKSQSSLPVKYGIDGLDGGSPLLFNVKSNIKSSRQMINDFLTSDVMHGEGNLLAHLVIVGYKVSYQQVNGGASYCNEHATMLANMCHLKMPLVEYDLRITDLFQDIQDGVRICRAIHLLKHDSSILAKMIFPADTPKKKVTNCATALEYLKKAGVSLQDEDGMVVVGEDIASGDKELILTLLWNMFVQLQLPLLITKTTLSEEISNVCKASTDLMAVDTISGTHLDMLLNWIKGICRNYEIEMEHLASLVDGKAMWCLLDFYFRKELHCSCSLKDLDDANEESIVSMRDSTDAVHNFVLSQKLTTLLGNFPEVLQMCELLEYKSACNEKSVIILLVFLSSQLLVKKRKDQLNFHKLMGCRCQNPDRKRRSLSSEADCNKEGEQPEDAGQNFKTVQAWWQQMAKQNSNCNSNPGAAAILPFSSNRCSSEIRKVNAAIVIQSHFRQVIDRKKYLKTKQAVSCLQLYMHAWLIARKTFERNKISASIIKGKCERLDGLSRGIALMVDRHRFVKQKSGATLIQKAARNWISSRRQKIEFLIDGVSNEAIQGCLQKNRQMENATAVCPSEVKDDHQTYALVEIQFARDYRQEQQLAATKIQSHFRGWLLHRRLLSQVQAAIEIQSIVRSLKALRDFDGYKLANKSATLIQSHTRGWLVRRGAFQRKKSVVVMQSHLRRCLARREFLRQKRAAMKIQSAFRVLMSRRGFQISLYAATEIQRCVRGKITRARLLGASLLRVSAYQDTILTVDNRLYSTELKIVFLAIVKLQRWWKRVLALKVRAKAAVIIQSYIRGCLCRQRVIKEKQHAVTVQAHWRGYLARKHAKAQLVDLRLRIQKSAATVEDGMRIMNRLTAALKELKSMRNVSGILHNCATLDMATTHSQKCCERLVDEGAVDILLHQICAVTRSIPDQEVLKHCLSTLRNLARYAHLADVLIHHKESFEIILRELLRNKEEGYFIACELLKKLCARPGGVEAICRLHSMLKRLHSFIEDLTRKAINEKRNHRGVTARDTTERRLKEVIELRNMITQG